MIRGAVDDVSSAAALGWLFVSGRKPATVQAWLDGQIIGEALADQHRPDLAAVGFGDGHCGFAIPFIREIGADYLSAIAIRPADCDLEIPRGQRADGTALLAILRQRYPAASLPASIFGGLWTDRTDARALLAGRVAVGITPGELAAPLAQFLQDGLMLLPTDLGPAASGNGSYATLATAALTRPNVLSVLRQVLEDNPLVLAFDCLDQAKGALYQPSTLAELASPAECLEIIVPLTAGVGVSVLRDSHRLQEFIAGVSRWTNRIDAATLSRALGEVTLDEYDVQEATLAVVGPGALHCLRLEAGAQALRLLVVPRRQEAPPGMKEARRRQRVHASGIALMT